MCRTFTFLGHFVAEKLHQLHDFGFNEAQGPQHFSNTLAGDILKAGGLKNGRTKRIDLLFGAGIARGCNRLYFFDSIQDCIGRFFRCLDYGI